MCSKLKRCENADQKTVHKLTPIHLFEESLYATRSRKACSYDIRMHGQNGPFRENWG